MKIILISATMIMIIFISAYFIYPKYSNNYKYVKEYNIGEEGIKGTFDKTRLIGKEYEVGANKYGFVVFKKPDEAFKKMISDYKEALMIIKKEHRLFSINNFNFYKYYDISCQMYEYDINIRKQASNICIILGVYENSLKK